MVGGVCAEGMRRIYICEKKDFFYSFKKGMRRGYALANLWINQSSGDSFKAHWPRASPLAHTGYAPGYAPIQISSLDFCLPGLSDGYNSNRLTLVQRNLCIENCDK